MNPSSSNRYKHHRFPVEIISHAVWLYFRFCLSYRDVEELLFVRGVIVSYEDLMQWTRPLGQAFLMRQNDFGACEIILEPRRRVLCRR